MERNYHQFFKLFADVSKAIHRGEKYSAIAASIVRNVSEVLTMSGSILWKLDDADCKVETLASCGNPFSSMVDPDYPAIESLLAAGKNNLVFTQNLCRDTGLAGTPFSSCLEGGTLAAAKTNSVGPYRLVLAVWSLGEKTLERDQQDLLVAFADQAALALHRNWSWERVAGEQSPPGGLRQIVEGLALALEAKDDQTHGHSLRVGIYARRIGAELGFGREMQRALYQGGLLHDIGKIGVANAILIRLGLPTLSAKEKDLVRRHPEIGARILAPLRNLHELLPMVLHHHERFDGSGFPNGLAGSQIPLSARIITVCDAFETMLSGRKHLTGMSLTDAVVNLEREAGRQFDPDVVLALYASLMKAPEYFTESQAVPENLNILLERLSQKVAGRKAGIGGIIDPGVYF